MCCSSFFLPFKICSPKSLCRPQFEIVIEPKLVSHRIYSLNTLLSLFLFYRQFLNETTASKSKGQDRFTPEANALFTRICVSYSDWLYSVTAEIKVLISPSHPVSDRDLFCGVSRKLDQIWVSVFLSDRPHASLTRHVFEKRWLSSSPPSC